MSKVERKRESSNLTAMIDDVVLAQALMDVFDPAVGLDKSKRMFDEAKQRRGREPVKEKVR